MNVVEVNNLTKIYDSTFKKNRVTALKDFSITVEEGSIFGLLGPNGAGKTTLVKILLGIVFPTEGKAKILGHDLNNFQIKKHVGYLPENHKFPHYLSGEDVLRFNAKLSMDSFEGLEPRINDLLKLVKMEKWRKTKIKKYSKGMMQRLGLAQALINDPDLVFLDEPTDGVDPIGRKEIRDVLENLKNEGKTIFLNSHLLSEVELITDRVAILHKGELIEEGKVEDLTSQKETYILHLEDSADLSIFSEKDCVYENLGLNKFKIKVADTNVLNKLIDKLRGANKNIVSIELQKNSLEDMFISLINETDKKNGQ